MDSTKLNTTAATLATIFFVLLCFASTNAAPTRRSRGVAMHMSTGILRDYMMLTADRNHDGKLSGSEIAWFYRNIASYDDYVSAAYGRTFIDISDDDRDGALNGDELLHMLVVLDAYPFTKKR